MNTSTKFLEKFENLEDVTIIYGITLSQSEYETLYVYYNEDADEDEIYESFLNNCFPKEFNTNGIKYFHTDGEATIFDRTSRGINKVSGSNECIIFGIDVTYIKVHTNGVLVIPSEQNIINTFKDEFNNLCLFIVDLKNKYGIDKNLHLLSLCNLNK